MKNKIIATALATLMVGACVGAFAGCGGNKGAAALQHLAKLADRAQELEKNPFSNITTFLGGYVLQAKDNRKALELVRKYWGGMLSMNATTFWEDFDLEWLKENPTRIDEMPIAGRKNTCHHTASPTTYYNNIKVCLHN